MAGSGYVFLARVSMLKQRHLALWRLVLDTLALFAALRFSQFANIFSARQVLWLLLMDLLYSLSNARTMM